MYQILHAFLLFFKYIYYARSQYNSSPLYVINRTLLNEKSWNFIINHCNFPLADNGNTICIANIDCRKAGRKNF